MAKFGQNMNLKIQMLAGNREKEFFERFYKKSQDFKYVGIELMVDGQHWGAKLHTTYQSPPDQT